jgi:D-alanyl-D-alanine carboxypeptidase
MNSFKLLISSLSIFSIVVIGCSKNSCQITPIERNDPIIEIPLEERLQSIIDAKIGVDDDKLVGVSVSIRLNGVERWALVGGISDVDLPITSQMKFGVGSITKTAIA